jgi:hypothetical protein
MRFRASVCLLISCLIIILICIPPASARCERVGFQIVCDPIIKIGSSTVIYRGFDAEKFPIGSVGDYVQKVKCLSYSQVICGGRCVYLSSDPNNCGSCGYSCSAGLLCCSGRCLKSCDHCGSPCPLGYFCHNGFCCPLYHPENCIV